MLRHDVSRCNINLNPVPQWGRSQTHWLLAMRGDSNNLVIMIVLNIVGVMLVMGAGILILRGLGWIQQIPDYVVWALLLLALGVGILGGIRTAR